MSRELKKLKLCEWGVCMTLFINGDRTARQHAIAVQDKVFTQAGYAITPAELSQLEQQIQRKMDE